ncbi:MAG: hypothetical protein WCU00_06010 [Candidatus Latescibacterota bacterium]
MKLHYHHLAGGVAVMVVTAGVCFIGCSKDSPTSDKGGGYVIQTGKAKTYTVNSLASLAVQDTVSGMTFVFPEGGDGTLSVAPVTSSPNLGLAATKVVVSYTGGEDVEILVPKSGADENLAFVYTRRPGVMVDNFEGEYSWWGIAPTGERDGASVFSLSPLLEQEGASKIAGCSASGGSITLAISSIVAGSSEAARIAAIRTSVAQAVDWWLANLPSTLAASARALIEGDLKYGIVFTSEGNVYDHSRHTFGPDANIELCVSADANKAANVHTIAHEVGHYMNHVLVGYDRYVEILDRMPTTWWGGIAAHGFADYQSPRKYVTEDYAFLSDALITGTVDGTDITQPVTQHMFADYTPDKRDFPSHEGFGVIMLGSLLRTDAKVTCFWPKSNKIPAPVVGAQEGDVLALVARGARDTNELRTAIQDYLDSRGNEYKFKLPAMLEPIGWSYNGSGKVVDKSGKAMQGVHVQSISQDGTKEYRTFTSLASDVNGVFNLTRIYPGTNILRFFWNSDKDSTDCSLTVDWTKPTNTSLDLGNFTIEEDIFKELQNTKTCSVIFNATHTLSISSGGNPWSEDRGMTIKVPNGSDPGGTMVWNGSSFKYSYNAATSGYSIIGSVNVTNKTFSANCVQYSSGSTVLWSFNLKNIPLYSGNKTFHFAGSGEQLQGMVQNIIISPGAMYNPSTWTVTVASTDWKGVVSDIQSNRTIFPSVTVWIF